MKKIYILLLSFFLVCCNTTQESPKTPLVSQEENHQTLPEIDPITKKANEYAIQRCFVEKDVTAYLTLLAKKDKTQTEAEREDAMTEENRTCFWANRRYYIMLEGVKASGFNADFAECIVKSMRDPLGDEKFNYDCEQSGANPKTSIVEPTKEDYKKVSDGRYRCMKQWVGKAKKIQSKADKRKLNFLMKGIEDRVPDNPEGKKLANIASDCMVMSFAVFGDGQSPNFMDGIYSDEHKEQQMYIYKDCLSLFKQKMLSSR